MTAITALLICIIIAATSFLSGLFGMAGGLILAGSLLVLLPIPTAMIIHAVTQIASNAWRTAVWWRHIQWPLAVAYMIGCVSALAIWSAILFVPSQPVALIFLGLIPFRLKLVPDRLQPNPQRKLDGELNGTVCMSLMLTTGVAGPLLDSFFLGGKLDRREIIATKGVCQMFGHGVKLIYLASLIDQAGAIDPTLLAAAVIPMIGTLAAKRFLEAMSEQTFRRWANVLIMAISSYYLAHGGYLWLLAEA